MRKFEYWIALKADGKEVLLFKRATLTQAQELANRYKHKGYHVKIKQKNEKRT